MRKLRPDICAPLRMRWRIAGWAILLNPSRNNPGSPRTRTMCVCPERCHPALRCLSPFITQRENNNNKKEREIKPNKPSGQTPSKEPQFSRPPVTGSSQESPRAAPLWGCPAKKNLGFYLASSERRKKGHISKPQIPWGEETCAAQQPLQYGSR